VAYTFKHGDRPLAGYAIQRGVGRGGFGEVYYALSDGGREVALKYLRDNPDIELRGVSACMNLNSPHLVKIFDVAQNAEAEFFIIMEYVSGPSLRDLLIAEPQGVGQQKAAFFVREICKGLGYLHDRGIVHRDLKPGNIFYEEGYVKIGDYGLSKFISVSRHSAQTASVGTVHYMAPEVGSGNYSRGIDIYAVGVMLYEMLLGRVPFQGSSMGEVLMKHLTAQPEVEQLPHPFGQVIRKALAKDPKERYQTVAEMAEELLGVDDIKRSIARFDAMSLSAVARKTTPDWPASPSPVPPAAQARPAGDAPASPRWSPLPPAEIIQVAADKVTDAAARAVGATHEFVRPQAPYLPPAADPAAALSPEAASGRLSYAGFWIRVCATLIDATVVAAACGCLLILMGASPGSDGLYLVLAIIYNGVLIGRWNGQTLGKKTCGIKVISGDGRPCGRWQAFARTFAELINMFTLGIGYLVVAFGSQKRGLHDHIANTLHVRALR
jgi:uncharacterized RDD family membrane protein YckC